MHSYSDLKRGERRTVTDSMALRQMQVLARQRPNDAELPRIGRYRKQRATACHKPACLFCGKPHHPKSRKKGSLNLTQQERQANVNHQESMAWLYPTSVTDVIQYR